MKIRLIVLITLLAFAAPANAYVFADANCPQLLFSVQNSFPDGGEFVSTATCLTNGVDEEFSTCNMDQTKVSWVALDKKGSKMRNICSTDGTWTAYIWSGTKVPAGTEIPVRITAQGNTSWEAILYDKTGLKIARNILVNSSQWAFTLSANPVNIRQWQTQGYRVSITAVPEPVSLFVMSLGLLGSFFFAHK